MKVEVLSVAAALLSGCYVYVQPKEPGPRVGDRISAVLTPSGDEAVARLVGPNIERIDGETLATGDSTVTIAVRSTTTNDKMTTFWKGETIEIPLAGIRGFEVRRFSLVRSVIAGAGVGGMAVLGAIILPVRGGGAGGLFGGGSGEPR